MKIILIKEVLNIFDHPDNVHMPNLMMNLNQIQQYTELFQNEASLLQQPQKTLPV